MEVCLPVIRPFPGVLFRVAAEDLSRVLAPPYDVISPAHADELRQRDQRNVVRLILNAGGDAAGYAECGAAYRRLLAEGTLVADREQALYLLEQRFTVDGASFTRLGLIASLRAEDPQEGSVLPHEHTRPAAKEDRYLMLKATRANFSPIFLMFADPAARFAACTADVALTEPALSCSDDDGVSLRLWRIVDPERVAALQELLASERTFIADGHHRYATALRYRDEVGPEGAWTMGYFTPLEAPGLVVLPYHRILSAGPRLDSAQALLSGSCVITPVADPLEATHLVARSTAPYAFALAAPGAGALVAEVRDEAADQLPATTPGALRALDSYFLHQVVLPQWLGVPSTAVDYVHSYAEAEAALSGGRCRLAVLMRATPVSQIVAVAEARESMPAKSTFFYPKLPSGLVIHPLVSCAEPPEEARSS